MTRRYTQIVVILLVTVLHSCAASNYIRVEGIRAPLRRVMLRHDAYVRSDISLTELQRRTRLRTTELLERVLQEAEKEVQK